jgi:hypothetical protein
MRLINFPSIEQYRNVVRNVQHKAQFAGLDEAGEPIMNRAAVLPRLVFEGTVKLHGTNASVVISPSGEEWAQSRKNIITPEKDNAGFAMFAHANMERFKQMAAAVDGKGEVVFYGEWCGGNIQKGVAICQLPKMFVIFGLAVADADNQKVYLQRGAMETVAHSYKNDQIRTIYDFPTWRKEIDFENPAMHQNELNAITEEVEAECPAGKTLGVSGVGEGVVWKCVTPGYEDSGFWFKVKGEKHAASKVRTLAKVDVEKLNSIQALAEQVANNERLEQMHQQVFDTLNGGETSMERMGDFIKAVMEDVFKEDIDLISASGFTGKELSGPVCKICRRFIAGKMELS